MESELIAHHTPIATSVLTKKKEVRERARRDMNVFEAHIATFMHIKFDKHN